MYIEINLLPPDLRRTKEPAQLRVKFIVNSFIVLLSISVAATSAFVLSRKRVVTLINHRWKELEPRKKEIDLLKAEIAQLKKKAAEIDALSERKFSWSAKMNLLSDMLEDGIWLTALSYEQQFASIAPQGKAPSTPQVIRFLIISGTAISQESNEMARIGRFMKNLRENKEFFGDFSDINMTSTQRRSIVDTEVMDFTLMLKFKEEVVF